jgi:hypothetical protein
LILSDDKNKSELEVVVVDVKQELRGAFGIIWKEWRTHKKIGKYAEEASGICEEIKIALKEEIAEGVISTRTIELYCPSEWKRKTKPKPRENEKISFSKQVKEKPQQHIAATQDGQTVITLDDDDNEERATDAGSKESLVTDSLRGEIPSAEGTLDPKKE